MKWIKKWSFIWILAASGVVFFTASDSWAVVFKPLTVVQGWYLEALGRSELPAADFGVSGGGIPSVSGQEQAEDGTHLSGGDSGRIQQASGGDSITGEQPGGEAGKDTPEGDVATGNTPDAGSENKQPDTEGEGIQTPVNRSPEEVEYISVEDDYFADAVFIGDSRTVGMFEYGGLEDITTFYASTGLTIFKLFDAPIAAVPGEKEKQTIEQALGERQFSKIYLMIGINEMGTGTVDTFIQKYSEVVEHLKELQPDAVIYLQGIMKVTTKRSEQGDYINNEGIEARNVRIEELADYVKVYYLDVNPLICDETGGMNPAYTFDGVHLKAQYIPIWKDFLKQHAVVLD